MKNKRMILGIILIIFIINVVNANFINGGFESGSSGWTYAEAENSAGGCSVSAFGTISNTAFLGAHSYRLYLSACHQTFTYPHSRCRGGHNSIKQLLNFSNYNEICFHYKFSRNYGAGAKIYAGSTQIGAVSTQATWAEYCMNVTTQSEEQYLKFYLYDTWYNDCPTSWHCYCGDGELFIDNIMLGTYNSNPEINLISPQNNSNIKYDEIVDLAFIITDGDGDSMDLNVTFYYEDNSATAFNYYNQSSGTLINISGFSDLSAGHKYNWSIVISDGTNTISNTYFFTIINNTYLNIFKIYDKDSLIPINNVSISIGTDFNNLDTEIFTDSSGKANYFVMEGVNYYYETYKPNYNSEPTQILTATWMNWTETIFLTYNETFTDLYIHVKDLTTSANITNASVSVETAIGNFLGYTNSSGIVHFNQIVKGNCNIHIIKNGYISSTKNNYNIFDNEHHYYDYLMNESEWITDRYNVSILILDNNSNTLQNVKIAISNLDNGYSDFRYTNSSGQVFIEDMYQGNIKVEISKSGYDSLVYNTFLTSNFNQNFTLDLSILYFDLTILPYDIETLDKIIGVNVSLYVVNSTGDYVYYYSQYSNNMGTKFTHIPDNVVYRALLTHNDYAVFTTQAYTLKKDTVHVINMSSLLYSKLFYLYIYDTNGNPILNSNVRIIRAWIEYPIHDLTLTNTYFKVFSLGVGNDYYVYISHTNYHDKEYKIMNHASTLYKNITLTLLTEIDPDNPLSIREYEWADLFDLVKTYGFLIFLALLCLFIYRTFTIGETQPPKYRKY